jgi:hypothetical protein
MQPPTVATRGLTPCMPCSFGLLRSRWSVGGAQLGDRLGVTVVVRCIPLVPARYGTRVARPARMTLARIRRRSLPARALGEARPRLPTASLAVRCRRVTRPLS